MKYRNLQLVSTKDSGYRAFGAQRRLENMKFRKKKERSPSDLISDLVEDAVRQHIGVTGTLDENRIWKYERLKQGSYVEEYREMDFVCRLEDGALIFGEVKSSNNKRSLTKALSQVGKNLKLAKLAEREANGVIVLCGTGEDFTDAPESLIDLPSRIVAESGRIVVVRIHLDDLRDGLDEGARDEWIRLQSLVEEQRAKAEQIRLERQDWRDRGVAVEDWPAHLQYPEPDELDQAEMMSFGSQEDDETPMQRAMREAMAKSSGNVLKQATSTEEVGVHANVDSAGISEALANSGTGSGRKESWFLRLLRRWRG